MYCPQCGAKNVESAKFCYACGTPLAPSASVPEEPKAPEADESMNQDAALEQGTPVSSQQPADNQAFQNTGYVEPHATSIRAQSAPANSGVGSKIAAIPTK